MMSEHFKASLIEMQDQWSWSDTEDAHAMMNAIVKALAD